MAVSATQTAAPRMQVLGLIPLQQKFGLMIALAAAVALVIGGWMWSQAPDYRVLYTNLSDRDGGAVIAALQQMNVPFKFADGDGALMVPANQVRLVRMRLAGEGLPKDGMVGFEVMDTEKLGTSQFQERVNYHRALEGELARTIQSLSAVASARVNLAFGRTSAFVRPSEKPTASVLLGLVPGHTLDASQVSAIVHLVASSIPDLSAKNVTVIDQDGDLLSAQDSNSAGIDPGEFRYKREVERSYVKRIQAILTPITGENNVRAQVTADMDFTLSENVAETYSPNQSSAAAVRSEQTSEMSGTGSTPAGGVPGALSNQPPANATAPITAKPGAPPARGARAARASAKSGTPSTTQRESTVNYEVDKTISHTRHPVGIVKRLSVAVVVNYRTVTDDEGNVTSKPLSAKEMAQITELVKEVMGYSKKRGDSLTVTNTAFSLPQIPPPQVLPLWKQPGTIALAESIGKDVAIAALVLFLVLGVLRPLLVKLAEARVPVAAEPESDEAGAQQRLGYAQNLDTAKQLARSEPKLVANVVREWVGSND